VKIIAFLRNPVDASYSLWKQIKYYGHESLSFEDALSAEKYRIHNRQALNGWPPNFFYTDRYKYSVQLQRYFDVFHSDKIKIFIFEEFFDAIKDGWKDMCVFLGIDPSFCPRDLGEVHNQGADKIKSNLIKDILLKDLWWKKPVTKLIPEPFKNRLRLKLDDWNKIRESGDSSPSEETQRHLQLIFKDDVRGLEKMVGRKLDQIWF
jgi:hypothetical protein